MEEGGAARGSVFTAASALLPASGRSAGGTAARRRPLRSRPFRPGSGATTGTLPRPTSSRLPRSGTRGFTRAGSPRLPRTSAAAATRGFARPARGSARRGALLRSTARRPRAAPTGSRRGSFPGRRRRGSTSPATAWSGLLASFRHAATRVSCSTEIDVVIHELRVVVSTCHAVMPPCAGLESQHSYLRCRVRWSGSGFAVRRSAFAIRIGIRRSAFGGPDRDSAFGARRSGSGFGVRRSALAARKPNARRMREVQSPKPRARYFEPEWMCLRIRKHS
jgi:hypothetical protein